MFINLVKKSFFDIVKNPIIALFLVLYFIVSGLLIGTLGSLHGNLTIQLALAVTAFAFIAIFTAGWLGVIKEVSVKKTEEEKEKGYVSIFLESIGENIVPFLLGLIIYCVFLAGCIYGAYFLAIKYFGNPQEIIMGAQASQDLMTYINSLSQEELEKLYAFPILFAIFSSVCMFLFMYYFPSMIFSEEKDIYKRAFIGFYDNFRFLFKHFFKSVLIFLFLFVIYAGFSIVKNLCLFYMQSYPYFIEILAVLFIFFIIYFMSFAVMLICNYYGENHSCNNGSDSLGEDKSDDKDGKED